ncbi:MAG: hypothetical protein GX629_01835 [Phycisphaerae bacterium]|nr:hypothetical protein [Phycisphaerae bacterium]
MSINYFRQYELRNRDIVTLAPAHEVNGISINPVQIDRSIGYAANELNRLRKIVLSNRQLIEDKWNESFGG